MELYDNLDNQSYECLLSEIDNYISNYGYRGLYKLYFILDMFISDYEDKCNKNIKSLVDELNKNIINVKEEE